nr:unnamed protein product [Digitaria exilis]
MALRACTVTSADHGAASRLGHACAFTAHVRLLKLVLSHHRLWSTGGAPRRVARAWRTRRRREGPWISGEAAAERAEVTGNRIWALTCRRRGREWRWWLCAGSGVKERKRRGKEGARRERRLEALPSPSAVTAPHSSDTGGEGKRGGRGDGGPGCSSVGYGAASELGPLLVNANGTGLEFNKFAWNKEANLLFLESPVGVGFSYTNTTSDLDNTDDNFVGKDTYTFLVNWLNRFPQYKRHDFYISGESYAGMEADSSLSSSKEIPMLNEATTKGYHLFAFLTSSVGNAETNDYYDYTGIVEFAWSHSVISDQFYQRVKNVFNFRLSPTTNECRHVMNLLFKMYREIDIYNVYAPKCDTDGSASSSSSDNSLEKVSAFSKSG